MKNVITLFIIWLLIIAGMQNTQAQQTLKVYGFAESYDSYDKVSYISEVVTGLVNDKTLFDPNGQNLQNQFKKKIGEILGKSVQSMNHNAYGLMYKRFKPMSLNGTPEKKEELSTESTLEAMEKLRIKKIEENKKYGIKVIEISNEQFQYIQPKR
ncbi:MAG: hypothetical protein CL868_02140 [Cytophagaceae bacterium]|nr:hypothetical protein [Cytophagaceae bacterium]|tara:strand:+ start:5382 stop:5846 length:465 start_codon:yes stop_codon:yes gene_type:complete